MSAKSGGSLATLLMSVPLAAIPLMAIFGIPQFAPVSASPDHERLQSLSDAPTERGDQDYYRRRSSDLFHEVDPRDRAVPLDDGVVHDPFQEDAPEARRSIGASDPRRSSAMPVDSRAERLRHPDAAEPPLDSLNEGRSLREDGRRPNPGDPMNRAHFTPHADRAAARSPATVPVGEQHVQFRETTNTMTWRSAAQELNERGIDNFRLERGHDSESFLFVCTLAPSDNPHVTMRFESEASEPLTAVCDVLDQVDVWLRERFAALPGETTASDATP